MNRRYFLISCSKFLDRRLSWLFSCQGSIWIGSEKNSQPLSGTNQMNHINSVQECQIAQTAYCASFGPLLAI
jgi:hypothetical protein